MNRQQPQLEYTMNKAVIILALSGLLFSPIGAMAAPKAPNVIVILIDDMGWIDSAPYGSEYYDTPNLTRLAEEGMLFTDAYPAGGGTYQSVKEPRPRWFKQGNEK